MLVVKGKQDDMGRYISALAVSLLLICSATGSASAQHISDPANVPSDIKAIMDNPHYKGADAHRDA